VAVCALAILSGASGASGEDTHPSFRKGTPALRPTATSVQEEPPKAPSQFNPDPGVWNDPALSTNPKDPLLFPDTPIVPSSLNLPRGRVLGHDPVKKTFTYNSYPMGREGLGLLPNTKEVPNRWMIPFPHWQRYRDPSTETPYAYDTPRLWDPYRQSKLKGDVPSIGQDIFLNLTAKNFSLFEARKLPVPSGVSTATPNSAEFFGRGEQLMFSNDSSFAFDLFKGETAFKPVSWLIRVNAVYNNNWTRVRENNLLNPDPRGSDGGATAVPNTSVIGAVTPVAGSANPQSGNPGLFTSNVNPSTAFNYLAQQLQPLGNASQLVPISGATTANTVTTRSLSTAGNDFSGTRYTTRFKDHFALQEAFAEVHIRDTSDNYDFVSSRFGNQPFISDFRGFIFSDTNLGARIFGARDNNRTQYNLAYFNMREKDTYSDLNTFDSRHQQVVVANMFRQDFLWKGYTAQVSLHMNFDDGGTHYDRNGFLTRPQTLGTVRDTTSGTPAGHSVNAYYLGWTGDGHIGRMNVTHAFYQAFGTDEFNSLAGRKVDINAQMAAIELSYDRDWYRLKLSAFYASGDSNPTNGTAGGFDTILDNPTFIGGPFSWYAHEGINLAGTSVNLKQRDSLVPNLRTSKTEGQSNFVNPGAIILGVGTDIDVTPKLKAFLNLNYIWLAEPAAIKVALQTDRLRNDLGLDASFGFKYRPLLTDNIVISLGMGFFVPGGGYRDIYRANTATVAGFGSQDAGKVDDFLYNGFFTVTFQY
jgi:hypothetical protein